MKVLKNQKVKILNFFGNISPPSVSPLRNFLRIWEFCGAGMKLPPAPASVARHLLKHVKLFNNFTFLFSFMKFEKVLNDFLTRSMLVVITVYKKLDFVVLDI